MGKRPAENCCILTGNLGADAEIRKTAQKGWPVANFYIAVARGRDETVNWFDVVVYGGLVDIIGSRLKKGAQVYIRGELSKRSWEAQDGRKMSKVEVIVGDSVPGSKLLILRDAKEPELQPDDGGDF